ncbi:MAG: hypothetical protein CMH57_15855 [Myxococcales bacterium]|nr:hypothetical protein [Myxococcales bacterium]
MYGGGEVVWKTEKNVWKLLKPRARTMRHEPTRTERVLWELLKARRCGGYKFRRQHSIGPYIADFYCKAAKLVVELDGSIHEATAEYDQERDAFMKLQGLQILRIQNEELLKSPGHVLAMIMGALNKPRSETPDIE